MANTFGARITKRCLKCDNLYQTSPHAHGQKICENCWPVCICGIKFKPAQLSIRYCSRKCAGKDRSEKPWKYSGVNSHMYGKVFSIETRKKISEARKGKRIGENHTNWKGGRCVSGGKVWIKITSNGSRLEHTLKAEKVLGRRLRKGEHVHHIDGNKLNNNNSNLLICSNSYHQSLHHEMSRLYMKEHFTQREVLVNG